MVKEKIIKTGTLSEDNREISDSGYSGKIYFSISWGDILKISIDDIESLDFRPFINSEYESGCNVTIPFANKFYMSYNIKSLRKDYIPYAITKLYEEE